MKYIVYYHGESRSLFVGYSWQSVENFCRENDFYNRQAHGWDCELDDYDVVCIPI